MNECVRMYRCFSWSLLQRVFTFVNSAHRYHGAAIHIVCCLAYGFVAAQKSEQMLTYRVVAFYECIFVRQCSCSSPRLYAATFSLTRSILQLFHARKFYAQAYHSSRKEHRNHTSNALFGIVWTKWNKCVWHSLTESKWTKIKLYGTTPRPILSHAHANHTHTHRSREHWSAFTKFEFDSCTTYYQPWIERSRARERET